MNYNSSIGPIDDVELAYDMAHAEYEFHEYELLSRAVGNHAQRIFEYVNAESTTDFDNYKKSVVNRNLERLSDTAAKNADYFARRADFASDTILAAASGELPPGFTHIGNEDGSDVIATVLHDNDKRGEVLDMATKHLDKRRFGLTILRLTEEQHSASKNSVDIKRAKDRKQDVARELKVRTDLLQGSDSLDTSANAMLRRIFPESQAIGADQIEAFSQLEPLNPMTLMDGYIRKQDVTALLTEFIAKSAWHQLLNVAAADLNENMLVLPTTFWKSQKITRSLESLLDKYNGTVTGLSVMKLPVTEEWKEEYFDTQVQEDIYEGSIERMRIVAKLKPTGKPEAYSVLDTVHYIRRYEKADSPVIVVTTRAADAMSAQALQNSLRQESIAVARVVADNQNREILVGLPTLGKRR